MSIDSWTQAITFAGALAVGLSFGLLYDLMRPFRRRGGFWRELTWDGSYWLLVTGGVVGAAILLGDGEIRLYMLLAHLLGAAVYFGLLSPGVRWLLAWLESVLRRALLLATRPFLYLRRKLSAPLAKFFIRLQTSRKKLFSFWIKWVKLLKIPKMAERTLRRNRQNSEESQYDGSQQEHQNQKGWSADEDRHLYPAGLSEHDPSQPAESDR